MNGVLLFGWSTAVIFSVLRKTMVTDQTEEALRQQRRIFRVKHSGVWPQTRACYVNQRPALDLDQPASSGIDEHLTRTFCPIEFVIPAMNGPIQENVETVPIADLIPTQVTVGMREVDVKRLRWREKHSHDPVRYLNKRRLPVILGPDARHYLIDHHHLTLALHEEGIWELPVSIIANMSRLSFGEFWKTLEAHNWTHPFDDRGRRCAYDSMPASVDGLIDDPFRSLAGALKRVGGYAKDRAPFSEFRWADFLRSRVPRQLIELHFGHALALASDLAHSPEAALLPGWRRHPE